MDSTKEPNDWIKAVQVWRAIRKSTGLPSRLPKRGDKEYLEIKSIYEKIKSGKLNPDDYKYVPGVPSAYKPEVPHSRMPKPSGYRVGAPSKRAREIMSQKTKQELKKEVEKMIEDSKNEKKKLEKDVEHQTEKVQERIIKLLAKLDKGKMTESQSKEVYDELKELQGQIGVLNQDATTRQKRIEEEVKAQKLKEEALGLSIMVEEAKKELNEKIKSDIAVEGLDNLNKHELATLTKIKKAISTGKPPERFYGSAGPTYLANWISRGAYLVAPSKEVAERLARQTNSIGFFAYRDDDGNIVSAGSKIDPVLKPAEEIQPTDIDLAAVAPVLSSMLVGKPSSPMVVDADALDQYTSDWDLEFEPSPASSSSAPVSSIQPGEEMDRGSGLLPGSRDTNPKKKLTLTEAENTEEEVKGMIRASAKKYQLVPGSRNTGIIGLGGGLVLSLGRNRTNAEAMKIQELIKKESNRILALRGKGVRVIAHLPGNPPRQ